MDPIAHTFVGAALAASGLRRKTPLAAAALIIGANIPDIDVLAYAGGEFAALAFRRGWTHGVLMLALWPLLVAGLLLCWDRWRRRRLDLPAARAGPLLVLAALGVLTHPVLDWLNNYGLRWLMPFDQRWFYGDTLFIIDPWLWLVLGGALFLMHSRRIGGLAAWGAFWIAASALVLTNAQPIPGAARAVWFAGVAALLAARALHFSAPQREGALQRATAGALALVAAYIVASLAAVGLARAEVRAMLIARGLNGVQEVMVAPVPANPFAGDVLVTTADAYLEGRWRWFAKPRFELTGERLERLPHDAVYEAAASTNEARDFLTWSRFPYVEIVPEAAGERVVRFSDARYRDLGRLSGPSVRLDAALRVLAVE